jgi:CHAT domain-containing protein/tetratricopeptide (TPR) repeat protein
VIGRRAPRSRCRLGALLALLSMALQPALAWPREDSLPAAKAAMDGGIRAFSKGDYARALPLIRQALDSGQRLLPPDDLQIGIALYYLAATYYQLGDPARAEAPAQRALEVGHKRLAPDDDRLAAARRLLASIRRESGDVQKALELDRTNGEAVRAAKGADSTDFALALNQIAVDEQYLGHYPQAREAIEQALAIGRARPGVRAQAMAVGLSNLAAIDAALGQYERGLPVIGQALKLYEAGGPAKDELIVTMRMVHARILCGLGRLADALAEARSAVATYEGLGNPGGRAYRCLILLAYVEEQLGRDADARPILERALALRQGAEGSRNPDLAFILTLLGRVRLKLGEREAALDLMERALPIAVEGGNPEYVRRAQDGMREVLAATGQREAAIYWGKAAVNTIQSVRASLRGMEEEAQAAFVQDKRQPYKDLAALLIDAGRLAEAEQVLALLKDEELAQLVTRGDAGRPSAALVGAERSAAERYDRLVADQVGRARELDELERRSRYEPLSAADDARRRELLEEATEWRRNFRNWVGDLPSNLAGGVDRAVTPQQVADQSGTLSSLVRSEPGAVGLYYLVTDEALLIIVVSPRASFGLRTEISAMELNRRIADLRRALMDPSLDPRPAAQLMYRTLIEPVRAQIEMAQAHTLVVSLTDSLRYVPFAALFDGRQYLAERYAVAEVAGGVRPALDAAPQSWQVSAFGLTEAVPPLAPLKGVRAELQAIVREPGTRSGVLPGTIRLDRDFDREHFEAALRGPHRVVHIGSHFVLAATGDEQDSYLLLGDHSHLSLDQIATLDFSGVDQLTLSACNTASGGGRNEKGIEVEGMAALVVQQGAASVLASLWPVSDASTAELMQAFYNARVSGAGQTRAEALRQAQLGLLRGRFAHPFYWAPFVILGSWL